MEQAEVVVVAVADWRATAASSKAEVEDDEPAAVVEGRGSDSDGSCCCRATVSSGKREARVGAGDESLVAWLVYDERDGGAGKAGKKGEEVAVGENSEGGCWTLLLGLRSLFGCLEEEEELDDADRSIRSAQSISHSQRMTAGLSGSDTYRLCYRYASVWFETAEGE